MTHVVDDYFIETFEDEYLRMGIMAIVEGRSENALASYIERAQDGLGRRLDQTSSQHDFATRVAHSELIV